MARASFHFPPDFLWGTATAAHQVEGNNHNNDWWAWEQNGHTAVPSGSACNWWNLDTAKADIDRAAALGTNAHRLSLEWSRIEPEPSRYDEDALAQYRALLAHMRSRGIEPMVTLHHFTNPRWLVEKGDFASNLTAEYFGRYARKVAQTIGDLVPKWITINEPLLYVYLRYLDGVFPPPQTHGRGWRATFTAVRNLLQCHLAAYEALKTQYPATQVGFAKQYRPFDPWPNRSFLDGWWANRLSWLFNDIWFNALHTGKLPRLLGGRIPNLAGSYDFIGLNYYTRQYARFPRLPDEKWPDGVEISETGYGEIYPHGLYRAIKYATRFNKPIYITENGLPDAQDQLRPRFIIEHLHQVWHAICFNFPVMGYYFWSLIDNFEWERGWTQRFGLYEVDPHTQIRTLRPSGQLYADICQSYQLNTTQVEQYAITLKPKLFHGRTPTPLD